MPDSLHDVSLLVEASNKFFKGIDDISAVLGRDDNRLVFVIPGLLVSKWRAPAPAALLNRLFHAVGRAFAFDIVFELREGADNVAHEFPDGIFFVVLSRGEKTDAEGAEVLNEFGLIGEIARKAIVFPDDQGREFLFVLDAILDEVLELGAVLGLGALAALDENFNNFETLVESELAAFFFLAFEAVAFLSLFFG